MNCHNLKFSSLYSQQVTTILGKKNLHCVDFKCVAASYRIRPKKSLLKKININLLKLQLTDCTKKEAKKDTHTHTHYLPVSAVVFFDRKGGRGSVGEGRGVSV